MKNLNLHNINPNICTSCIFCLRSRFNPSIQCLSYPRRHYHNLKGLFNEPSYKYEVYLLKNANHLLIPLFNVEISRFIPFCKGMDNDVLLHQVKTVGNYQILVLVLIGFRLAEFFNILREKKIDKK